MYAYGICNNVAAMIIVYMYIVYVYTYVCIYVSITIEAIECNQHVDMGRWVVSIVILIYI